MDCKTQYAVMLQDKMIGGKPYAKKGEKVLIISQREPAYIVEHTVTKERFSVNEKSIELL